MSNATDNLRDNQTQLDADGCMVGVSREALGETLGELEALRSLAKDCYRFLHSYYTEGQPSYDQPPEPADEMSHNMVPLFVAIQHATGENHDQIVSAAITKATQP